MTRLPVLFAVALVLRILFLLETAGRSFHYLTRYAVDPWYFWTMAQRLAQGGFRVTEAFFMPPLYPYFLALYSLVFGSRLFGVQLIQILLGSASAVLVFFLARRLFDRRVAIWSFVGYCLAGNLLFLDCAFLPHALTVFGELLLLWLLALAADRAHGSRPHLLLTAGIVLGLLILIRSELLLMLPLLLLVTLFQRRVLSRPRFGWLLLGAGLVIAPVTVHNLVASRDFTLVSYNGGLNFYIGNSPQADGTWQPAAELSRTGSVTIETLKRNSLTPGGTLLSPAASSGYWTKKALAFIAGNPLRFLELCARRLGLFIGNYEIPNNYYLDLGRAHSWILRLLFLPFGLVLALGLAGMLRALRATWSRGYGFVLLFAVYLITSLFIFTMSRLRAPVVPLLLPFAASFGLELYDRFRPRRNAGASGTPGRPGLVLPAGLAIVIFAASFAPLADRRAYALEGLVQAGNVYLDLKRPAAARLEFEQAARLDPNSLLATYGRFNAAARLKNRVEAERWLAELYRLSRSPADSVYAFLGAGLLGTMTGDFPRARDSYARALARDPANTDTRFLLASVLATLNDFGSARAQLDTLLSLNPDDREAQRLFAMLPR